MCNVNVTYHLRRSNGLEGPAQQGWSTACLTNKPLPPRQAAASVATCHHRVMRDNVLQHRTHSTPARSSGRLKPPSLTNVGMRAHGADTLSGQKGARRPTQARPRRGMGANAVGSRCHSRSMAHGPQRTQGEGDACAATLRARQPPTPFRSMLSLVTRRSCDPRPCPLQATDPQWRHIRIVQCQCYISS